MSAKPTAALEFYAFVGLVAAFGLVELTVFAYAPLIVGAFFWFAILARERRWPDAPASSCRCWPLPRARFISSAFLSDPARSFFRDRQLLYCFLVR